MAKKVEQFAKGQVELITITTRQARARKRWNKEEHLKTFMMAKFYTDILFQLEINILNQDIFLFQIMIEAIYAWLGKVRTLEWVMSTIKMRRRSLLSTFTYYMLSM